MGIRFSCPACWAPLISEGDQPTMVCPYCHHTVLVPMAKGPTIGSSASQPSPNKVTLWMILIIAAIVVIPTFIAIVMGILAVLGVFLGLFLAR